MNLQELTNTVKEHKIIGAISSTGKKYRFFISDGGYLCFFKKNSSRRGYPISDVSEFTKYIYKKNLSTESILKKKYNAIAKYKKMAKLASFNNSFIETCKSLPDFNTWINDTIVDNYSMDKTPRPKSLYELHVTSGCSVDGKVISIDRIAKYYPHYAQQLRDAIKNKTESRICSRMPFSGYEMSISTQTNDSGAFIAYLSLEYKGCGNGYYYTLINDDNFIGIDVD